MLAIIADAIIGIEAGVDEGVALAGRTDAPALKCSGHAFWQPVESKSKDENIGIECAVI